MEAKELLENITSLAADFARKQKEMIEALRPSFADLFKEVFEKYPEIKSFSWNQYTPYFNDGDECLFSVGDVWPCLEENVHGYGGEDASIPRDLPQLKTFLETGDAPGMYPWHKDNDKRLRTISDHFNSHYYQVYKDNIDRWAEVGEAAWTLADAIRSLPDDVMLMLFGNHVSICVSRNGVDVQDFDHD
jgi:hypothetical protein